MKTILYLSRTANRESIGIINKVKNTVKALNELGYGARAIVFHEYWLKGSIKVGLRLLKAQEDMIILRSDHHTMLVMLLPMLYARIKGKKIVVDIPNPIGAALNEIDGSNANFLVKKIKKILLYITFPVALYPAHRILVYSHDSAWFSFGIKKKIKLISNGTLVESIPFRSRKPPFNKSLNLIGVGHLAFWHGYDRMIRSIHAYEITNHSNPNKVNISFSIVGDGFEMQNLKSLVKKLKLEQQIKFLGVKEEGELAGCFANVHVGVCNLAQFRKRLFFNSELKARDYASRGIPFILACDDYDFNDSMAYVFKCENDDSLIELDEIIKWYENLDRNYEDFSNIRKFALDNLDYKVKVMKDILSVF